VKEFLLYVVGERKGCQQMGVEDDGHIPARSQ
jgi:hypothetical protein